MTETWNEAAQQAVETIYQNVRQNPKVSVKDLREELDKFIDSLWSSPGGAQTAMARWSNIGATAFELAAKLPSPLTAEEVHLTLVKKQHDYGPENISRFGRRGLMVRMHDKVARLENLEQHGRTAMVGDESTRDTLMDIVGYSAIGVMWERNEFLLPFSPPSSTVDGGGRAALYG